MPRMNEPPAANPTSDLHLHVVADYGALSYLAADIVTRVVHENPGGAITLPTGETPRGMYEELARRIERGDLDFANIHGASIHFVPSEAPDPTQAAAAYDAEITGLGGLKLAVLGLGRNGHIAF